MLRCSWIVSLSVALATGLAWGSDADIWEEYGLVQSGAEHRGAQTITTHHLKDLTGAVAAFEWLRSPEAKTCDLARFCSQDANRTTISEANYVVVFEGPAPTKAQVDQIVQALPEKRSTSLPAILSFLPREGRVPNSARYILGNSSLAAFAPELKSANPGLDQGAEAQIASYQIKGGDPVRLAIFYYPTPEMARLHSATFRQAVGTHVKRSAS